MKRSVFLGLALFGIAVSGCVSKSTHESEVNSLQAQILQMDAALREQSQRTQELESQLASTRGMKSTGTPGVLTGVMYRTPSGFEVPALDVQKALKNAGYYSGSIDGKIGPDSREAVRNFQSDNGLTPDGVIGQKTWSKLKTNL